MRRRDFISLLGGSAVAWPIAARAQEPERMRRIGVLMGYPENDLEGPAFFAAFREGLEKLGWVEDRNIRFDTRWATPDDAEARQRFAKELVTLQPDLILSAVTPTTAALLEQTRTIAIVFATVSDPVGSGFVASLARPGGNVTGFQSMVGSLAGKWLELLKEIAPRVARVAMLFNPTVAPYAESFLNSLQSCRFVLRSGGDRSPCSRHVRARICCCRTGPHAEWRPDRAAGYLHGRPSCRHHIAGSSLRPPCRLSAPNLR
jgi:putative ABC transport system substrate-binding protein